MCSMASSTTRYLEMDQRDSKSKVPWILGGIFVVGALSLGAYVWYQQTESDFPIWQFTLTVVGIITALALVGGGIYWFLNQGGRRDTEISSPKELVSTKRAIQIWKEEFMQANQIPYIIPRWESEDMQPCNPDALEVRDIMAFTDPLMQTSDRFLTFEVIVREGRNTGMLVSVIPLDLGEKYLRDNWNSRMKWNTGLSSYKPQVKTYPLTSSRNYAERLSMKSVELAEEGYTQAEINEMLSPFLQSQRATQQEQDKDQGKKKPPIKSPEVTDVFPQYKDEEPEADVEDVQEDIESYRRRGQ